MSDTKRTNAADLRIELQQIIDIISRMDRQWLTDLDKHTQSELDDLVLISEKVKSSLNKINISLNEARDEVYEKWESVWEEMDKKKKEYYKKFEDLSNFNKLKISIPYELSSIIKLSDQMRYMNDKDFERVIRLAKEMKEDNK